MSFTMTVKYTSIPVVDVFYCRGPCRRDAVSETSWAVENPSTPRNFEHEHQDTETAFLEVRSVNGNLIEAG